MKRELSGRAWCVLGWEEMVYAPIRVLQMWVSCSTAEQYHYGIGREQSVVGKGKVKKIQNIFNSF